MEKTCHGVKRRNIWHPGLKKDYKFILLLVHPRLFEFSLVVNRCNSQTLLRVSIRYTAPIIFHPISTKRDGNYGNWGGGGGVLQVINCFGDQPNIEKIWHFYFFLNKGSYGAVNFKMVLVPQVSNWFQTNFMRRSVTTERYWLLIFCKRSKCGTLTFYYAGQREDLKIWNILADRIVEWNAWKFVV